jgi:pimeloyl-ACP methyl ester carboxylesterase
VTVSATRRALDNESGPQPAGPEPRRGGRLGWIVLSSLAVGPVAALLFAALPFVPPRESEITGAVLCGFAFGWAMLAVLSERFTDQPQRWGRVPAGFLGVSGLLLAIFGAPVQAVLNWIWPPALLAIAVWIFTRIRRGVRSRAARMLLYPALALMAVASIAGGYETVKEAADAAAYPMPGELVDIGGHRLHLNCTGSGTPTVILEPGAGGTSSWAGWIGPAVAEETRVCVYDRAGKGWSEQSDVFPDADQIAGDLHTLLSRAGVDGPYVLAGHSFGGLYVRAFASLYPDEVAGMVLIDSTAAADAGEPAAAEVDGYDPMARVSALGAGTARLGLARLIAETDYDTLPQRSRDEARASASRAAQVGNTIDEYAHAGSSAVQAARFDDFGDKPLVVLTAEIGSSPGWLPKQEAMAALSTNSDHRIIPGSTHASLMFERDHASQTTAAILDVVSAARTGTEVR